MMTQRVAFAESRMRPTLSGSRLLLSILMGGAAGVVAGGCSNASTPTALGTQQSLVAQEAPSQPAGTIFSVEIVDGKALNYTTRDLPASASKSSAAFMQEPKPPPPPFPARQED
jgi:hypothetical protein